MYKCVEDSVIDYVSLLVDSIFNRNVKNRQSLLTKPASPPLEEDLRILTSYSASYITVCLSRIFKILLTECNHPKRAVYQLINCKFRRITSLRVRIEAENSLTGLRVKLYDRAF